jgi:hypothetical protein
MQCGPADRSLGLHTWRKQMRVLTNEEMAAVGGGFYEGWSAMDYGGGGEQYAGLWTIVDWIGRAVTIYDGVNYLLDTAGVGRAGANGSEMDNGGTSYGIGVCNTFGCP